MAALDAIFAREDADVVFINEARLPGPMELSMKHFTAYSGPAENGQLGCQIWFANKLIPSLKISFEACSPRLVVAWVRGLAAPTALCSCHAPHNGSARIADEARFDLFYEQLGEVVQRARAAARPWRALWW